MSVPSTETVSTMGVQWRITPRIDSLDTKKKTYLSCNPEHVCSFYICIPTFYFKTIISALIRRTITIQSQLYSFTIYTAESWNTSPVIGHLKLQTQLLKPSNSLLTSIWKCFTVNAMIILLHILFCYFFYSYLPTR